MIAAAGAIFTIGCMIAGVCAVIADQRERAESRRRNGY